ncbi:hypothetical protein XENOCAPTIV_026179, partial [Xenoophorus captivus]
FIMLTYIFMLAWLGVTAFTSIPVFIYFNIWNICQNATGLEGTSLCLDPRQYGIVPLAEAKTVCAGSEKFYKMCESTELVAPRLWWKCYDLGLLLLVRSLFNVKDSKNGICFLLNEQNDQVTPAVNFFLPGDIQSRQCQDSSGSNCARLVQGTRDFLFTNDWPPESRP